MELPAPSALIAPCPFFSLPDETIARIVTIGTEIDVTQYRDWFQLAYRKSPFGIRPYDTAAAAGSTCQRFRSIVRAQSNWHLYYSCFVVTGAVVYERRIRGLGVEKQFVQTVNALKSAQKFDIHLLVDVNDMVHNTQWYGYLRHTLRLLQAHRSRIAVIDFITPEDQAWTIEMVMRWLGHGSPSWTRLKAASLSPTGRTYSGSSNFPFYSELFKQLPTSDQTVAYIQPSLVNLSIKYPMDHDFWRRWNLPMLRSLTMVVTRGADPSSWNLVRWIISESQTLRHVGLRLTNLVAGSELRGPLRSDIEELNLEMDVASLHTVFTRFSFPVLVKACIILNLDLDGMGFPLLDCTIHLPSLKRIGLLTSTRHPHVPFLELCRTPPLEQVSLAVHQGHFLQLQMRSKGLLGAMKKLSISLDITARRMDVAACALNMLYLEELDIFGMSNQFMQSEVSGSNRTRSVDPVPVPCLKTVRMLLVASIWDVLTWLQRNFLITSSIKLIVNNSITLSLEPATSQGSNDDPWFTSAKLRDPAPLFPFVYGSYRCRDRYFISELYDRDDLWEFIVPVSQNLLTYETVDTPHFRLLTELQFEIQGPLERGVLRRTPHLLRSLSTRSFCISEAGDKSILLPSLRSISIACAPGLSYHSVNKALIMPLKQVVLIRKSIALPLDRAEIVVNGETKDFARLGDTLTWETIML